MYLSPPSLLLFSFCLSKKSEYKDSRSSSSLCFRSHLDARKTIFTRGYAMCAYTSTSCMYALSKSTRACVRLNDTRRVTPRNRSNTG